MADVTAPALLALLSISAAALPLMSDGTAWGSAMKVVLAAAVVGVGPGAVATLLWRPLAIIGLLEFLALSIAVSFGLVHLLTVFMIVTHVGVPTMAVALPLASFAGSAWLLFRYRDRGTRIHIDRDAAINVVVLIVAAVFLYIQGSPVADWEDRIHVSIVRRLAVLVHPALDNLFPEPGVVYAYPFPSIHAFMALIASTGDIDALFVYHKLRFFWGPAALVMLYLAALAVFERRVVASAALLVGGVLALAGVFADVPGTLWAQMAPVSHASDVAMGVLLPGLLAVTYRAVESNVPRERGFLKTVALLLVFMLVVVHVREIIQYLAYLGCFVVVAVACPPFRLYARRAAMLLVPTLAIAAVYLFWNLTTVTQVAAAVSAERQTIVGIAVGTPIRDLFLAPASEVIEDAYVAFDTTFHGLNQFLLFAGPVVVVAFRHRPLVWLAAGSTIAYLLVISVPVLAIPYLYATNYQILFTPVRNVTPFLHLLAGPFMYVVVSALASATRHRVWASISVLLAGAAAGAVAFLATLSLNRSEYGFFLPAIAAWGATFLFLNRPESLTRTRAAAAAVLAAWALSALAPDHSPAMPPVPVNVRWTTGLDAGARGDLEGRFSLGNPEPAGSPDVWVYTLGDTSRDNVRALISNPDVKDTHHIDRSSFEVEQPPKPWYRYPGRALSYTAAAGVWACGFVLPHLIVAAQRRRKAVFDLALAARFHQRALLFGLFLLPFTAWTALRDLAPAMLVPVRPFGHVGTPGAIPRQLECVSLGDMEAFSGDGGNEEPVIVSNATSCPPNAGVLAWVHANVSPEAVFATDRWNQFLPSTFMPQQVAAIPGFDHASNDGLMIFGGYYPIYQARMRTYRAQPFFNAEESIDERTAFLQTLGITHVLVDPAYYALMRPVLDALPQMFSLKYADGLWAVYEVNPPA